MKERYLTNRGRGRPTDFAKRDAILDGARAQFLAKGFERTTMESVAEAAGVSKVTIFNHFRDKASLLEATVEREAHWLEQAVVTAESGGGDPLSQLAKCGEALLELLLNPDVLALDRLLSAEPYRGSDLVRRFFAAGPKRGREMVAQLIGDAVRRGVMQTHDLHQAADDLLALWIGATWREEIALGLRSRPRRQQIRARVRRGLDGIVRLYPPSN